MTDKRTRYLGKAILEAPEAREYSVNRLMNFLDRVNL